MYLTLKQIAERAGIGASLAAFYRDRFGEYLKVSGEGRNRKYDESNIELFMLVARHYKEGLDYDQIKQNLDNKYGYSVPNSTELAGNSNTKVAQQEDLAHTIRHVLLEELTKQNRIILQLQEELDDMRAEFNEGFAGVNKKVEDGHRDVESRDIEVLQRLNDSKVIQQQRNKPLWRRIFNRT